ncbi:hypothetical protein SRHO_G00189380 [Serrasalmus rhombeus]
MHRTTVLKSGLRASNELKWLLQQCTIRMKTPPAWTPSAPNLQVPTVSLVSAVLSTRNPNSSGVHGSSNPTVLKAQPRAAHWLCSRPPALSRNLARCRAGRMRFSRKSKTLKQTEGKVLKRITTVHCLLKCSSRTLAAASPPQPGKVWA